MSAAPKEQGQDVAHELMSSPSITITQAGYVYIYLSNEETTPVEVYFDDFKVTHTKSPVVQTDDYYPFGLTFNSFQRENSTINRWKFQGQEHVDELGLGWDSFKWRNHQPEIGRFFNIDPLADKYVYNSPYAFSENRVVNAIELEGLEALIIHGKNGSHERTRTASGVQVGVATAGAIYNHPIASAGTGQFVSGSTNLSSVSARVGRHISENGVMSRGDGSEENAFRHALWSGSIAQQYGSEASQQITNGHEGIGPAESATVDFSKKGQGKSGLSDSMVDLLNNDIGRSIAENLPENATTKDIATAVLGVQLNEGLWTVRTDKDGNSTLERTKISQKQYDKAIKTLNSLDSSGFNKKEQKDRQSTTVPAQL
jgi:RHS repeat-associated protein